MRRLRHHPYHIVEKTLWPILGSVGVLSLIIGGIFRDKIDMILGISIVMTSSSLWWRDCTREGSREYTKEVRIGLKLGFILFIVSEVLLFISILWAYIHVSLIPSVELFNRWEGTGIDPLELPLLNTVLLLSSGCTITLAHNKIVKGDKVGSKRGIILTIIVGTIFIICQGIEYKSSAISISDGIVGSIFYMSTGTHGLHIILGTIFIIVQTWNKGISRKNHLGIEFAILYWHFVDIVWIILYILIY